MELKINVQFQVGDEVELKKFPNKGLFKVVRIDKPEKGDVDIQSLAWGNIRGEIEHVDSSLIRKRCRCNRTLTKNGMCPECNCPPNFCQCCYDSRVWDIMFPKTNK